MLFADPIFWVVFLLRRIFSDMSISAGPGLAAALQRQAAAPWWFVGDATAFVAEVPEKLVLLVSRSDRAPYIAFERAAAVSRERLARRFPESTVYACGLDPTLVAVEASGDLALLDLDPNLGVDAFLKFAAQFAIGGHQDGSRAEEASIVEGAIAKAALEIVQRTFDAAADRQSSAKLVGVKGRRARDVLRYTRTHFRDPDLTAQRTAKALGITTRYLSALLAELGFTFSERVIELRLQFAFRALTSESVVAEKIGQVGFDSGFSDQSHFNRCFKRRFGVTPKTVRGGFAAGARPA